MSLSFRPGVWILPIAVLLISTLIQGLGWVEALRYERSLVLDGQVWRLVTGNLTHLGWRHLALNGVGVIMIWVFFDKEFSSAQWWVLLLVCGLGVTCGLLLLDPHLIWYVGLSGLLHGLFIAGAIQTFRGEPLFSGALLLGFALKLGWEQMNGALPSTAEMAGGPVVVNAHLYGAIAGLVAGLLLWLWKQRSAVGKTQ